MTTQKDRIEAAIRHIQTASDVDPWAMELAVDALKAQGTCEDAVSRQTLQKELAFYPIDDVTSDDEEGYNRAINDVQKMVLHLPSAQPERKKGKWIERNPQNSDKCRLIECNQCGFSHIVGFNVPYEHWIENRNFCERCGADMRGEGVK